MTFTGGQPVTNVTRRGHAQLPSDTRDGETYRSGGQVPPLAGPEDEAVREYSLAAPRLSHSDSRPGRGCH